MRLMKGKYIDIDDVLLLQRRSRGGVEDAEDAMLLGER